MDLLNVNNLTVGYGNAPVLKNVSFSVKNGEYISVIGKNGSGKSTLVKAVNGILNNYNGNILYKGKSIKNIKPLEKAREIAVIYQNSSCAFEYNCFDVAAMGLYPHKGMSRLTDEDVRFVTDIMNITDTYKYALRSISSLSGGQKQRVLLARALVQKPQLLFIDEAMSGLDISARIEMTDVLINQCKNGLSVVSVQHDINAAFEKSSKILALRNGEVHSFGAPRDLLNKEFFREVFDVEVEIEDDKYFRFIL